MKPPLFALLAGAFCLIASGQSTTPDVGSGAPSDLIRQQFQIAYYRNGFAYQVNFPPLADVKKLSANGLLQEFGDAKNASLKWALVAPNANAPISESRNFVFQLQGTMYSYFNSVGVATAGMPTIDTANCPALAAANACQYQFFDKNYALFVYKNLVNLTATNFATRDPYYTKWLSLGGIQVLGPASSAETAVTSSTAATATVQTYDQGAIYNFTTGLNAGKQIAIKQPVWGVYLANNMQASTLGFPVSEELMLSNGHKRQNFENGSIEYDPVTGSAFLRPAALSVTISGATNPIKLKLGDTAALQATVYDTLGNSLTDRDVLWTTSNSRIVSVQPGGLTALVKAAGGGTATIRASSEGKSSNAVTVIVTAPCCQVGEGAPSPSIAQAFQDAVTRNKLNVKLPAAAAVTRAGAGYLQALEAADGSGQTYIVMVPDRVLTGVVLTGKLLARYLELGGPLGALGYPVADATAGGRQMFENGALAGDPPLAVTGDILAKWGVLGYEAGIAGPPAAAPLPYLTFRATAGQSQAFRGAVLYASNLGASTRTFAVTGLVLARYAAAGGAPGKIGAPTSDEYGLNGRRRQDFEGGWIDYAPGDTVAQLNENARQPVVTAAPAAVIAGTPVRLAIGGFANGANVRVSIAGQPDFVVNVPAGAYVWDAFIPAAAPSGAVAVKAVDTANPALSAQGSYMVRSIADVHLQLTAVRGDNQVGPPGSLLPAPLRVALKDDSGNPVPGVAVQFSASSGAKIESFSSVTDAGGEAAAAVRLPPNNGLALVTATAARLMVTFNARAAQTVLANFPKLSQAVDGTLGSGSAAIADKGAMLTAAAMILRYHQSRGELPSTSGLADPVALNEYLKAFCVPDGQGVPVCDGYLRIGASPDPIVNLWRLSGFAGNAVDVGVEKPALPAIRDLLAQGSPVMLALALSSGNNPLGSHFVVATGVAGDGGILIADPSPVFARSSLNDYLAGFNANGQSLSAVLTGAVRLLPRAPQPGGFLVAVNAAADIASPAGSCGLSFEFPDTAASAAGGPLPQPTIARLRACDGGTSSIYQLDLNGTGYQGTFTALGNPANRVDVSGSGPTAFKVSRSGSQWGVSPIDVSIAAGGVVNAASFTADIAPGGIAAIFGTGFGRNGSATVSVGGVPAQVLASFPFQLNVQIPPEILPGTTALHIGSDFGSVDQTLSIVPVAPAIFVVGPSQAAVLNRDGKLNTSSNPARRGDVLVVYGTGLGVVSPRGNLMVADVPVTALLGGAEVPAAFAGLAPGFVGLYQINLMIPSATPPGLHLSLAIKQANSTSNTVEVAVQ